MRFAILALVSVVVLPGAEIPKGSHALLKMVNSISTRTAREGDYVYMRTATPIVAENEIVIPENSYVQGVVTHSKRPGRVTGTAELSIRIETLTLATGKVIKVRPTMRSIDSEGTDQKVVGNENEVKQGASKGKDAETIATTGGAGAAIGGLADRSWKGAGIGAGAGAGVGLATVLLTRGREVELKQGTTIDVIFEHAVPID
jgi:type IV secretion system protein VirB10